MGILCGVCNKEILSSDPNHTLGSLKWRRGMTGGVNYYCIDHLAQIAKDAAAL